MNNELNGSEWAGLLMIIGLVAVGAVLLLSTILGWIASIPVSILLFFVLIAILRK